MRQVKNNSGYLPVGHAVLIRTIELEEKQSAIHIPRPVRESAAANELTGVVVAIGADCWNGVGESQRARVGDVVLCTKYAGGILPGEDGNTYRMIPDHSIYAVKVNGNE